MCGIAGILETGGEWRRLSAVSPMTTSMRRRGPDDEGLAFFYADSRPPRIFSGPDTPSRVREAPFSYIPREAYPGSAPEGAALALGHRRLSILDLSPAGHQPMSTRDGRYHIVFNGEIYNFREVRADLEALGQRFSSESDTEVILSAFCAWGPSCLQRFNGMWAFAIWDDRKKRLFCARDRIGIKPFYYVARPGLFLFASDVKALIASGLYAPSPDWEGVYHAMSCYCAPRPLTCFEGVRALPQGCFLTLGLAGDLATERYWEMPLGEIDDTRSDADWVEAVREGLTQSVRRRLVSDVPVGTFMSGGIDSTTMTAVAAREHPGIAAFTLAFEAGAAEMDELPEAEATARRCSVRHIVKRVAPEETLPHLPEMVRCYEEPFYSLAANYVISRFVAENNITVVLNGLGGDELFCGYGRERWVRLWQAARHLRGALRFLPPFTRNIRRVKECSDLSDLAEVYLYSFATFTEPEKQALFGGRAPWNTFEAVKDLYNLRGVRYADALQGLTHLDILNYVGNHHVYRTDQFTMHFSLESRFPYLDYELVELACRMPAHLKVRDGVGKWVLREVARDLIDPSCLAMKKKGFGLPVARWMRGPLRALVEEKTAALIRRGVFSREAVSRVKDDFYLRRANHPKLWFLVSLEMWLEAFFDAKTR